VKGKGGAVASTLNSSLLSTPGTAGFIPPNRLPQVPWGNNPQNRQSLRYFTATASLY